DLSTCYVLPVRAVRQGLGDQRAEDDDVGGVDRRTDGAVGIGGLDEGLESLVDRSSCLHRLTGDQWGRAVQRQEQLVTDRAGVDQVRLDRVQSAAGLILDVVQDVVQQPVRAVLECAQQRVAIGV